MSPEPLRDAAARRSSDAIARGRAALAERARRGEQISFQAVAREAGVSRQWLYTQPELRAEIEQARAARVASASDCVPPAERSSEASLRQRGEGLLEENRRLRQENGELREELALAYGHRREARTTSADHAG
jgi:hypothetical protein